MYVAPSALYSMNAFCLIGLDAGDIASGDVDPTEQEHGEGGIILIAGIGPKCRKVS